MAPTTLTSRIVCALALLALTASQAAAQAGSQRFTIDDLYDPAKRAALAGTATTVVAWLDDRTYLVAKPDEGDVPGALLRVDAQTGRSTPFLDVAKVREAVAGIPGIGADEARRAVPIRGLVFDTGRTAVLVAVAGDLYRYTIATGDLTRLTSSPGEEHDPAFSPDGRLVAFTRGGNLFVVDAAGRERQLTTDGHARLLNGRLDWVYQEEIYGRRRYRAFWWSPDSERLAFLQLDLARVPDMTLIDDLSTRPALEVFGYPKAGDPNPVARVGVVGAAGGAVTWMDLARYTPVEPLVVSVDWKPDGASVVFQVQDREQTWLDLNLGDPRTGSVRTLLRETTRAWVSVNGDPAWLDDGTFLWFSERNGWQHLYHYKADGTLVRQVTDGKWEARTLHGVDETSGSVYFSGTERSHIGSDLYRVGLDGTGLRRLTERAGTHSVRFNPSYSLFLDTWSDVTTPPQLRLHAADGREVRLIDENRIEALTRYAMSTPEFVQVTTRDGFVMEAMLIKPPDFDPSKKYPVYQHTYAGPHAPQVRNAWTGVNGLYNQMLAQHGIVVWVCDNRSASGKGAESAWAAYKRLGETELADIEEGLDWLTSHPWVDASRIGINGWSYGGFMVSYALTHSTRFRMGIAGGSVTDWRLYDSIYTERYMRLPQNNAEGYARTAPSKAAKNLHGDLLLVHGAIDDNVHAQNTMQFAYELQRAGKPFELMIYPKSRHGVTDPRLARHMRQMMFDFVLRTLAPEARTPATN